MNELFAIFRQHLLWALMLWVLFFVVWYLIGIPLGPGWPVR